MYMSEGSRATEIITDQSSEINVLIPNGDDFVSALNGGTATALFTREVQGGPSGRGTLFVVTEHPCTTFQVEQAIPEHFKTVVDGLKLKTSVVEIGVRE